MAGSCEHGNEPTCSIKVGNLLSSWAIIILSVRTVLWRKLLVINLNIIVEGIYRTAMVLPVLLKVCHILCLDWGWTDKEGYGGVTELTNVYGGE